MQTVYDTTRWIKMAVISTSGSLYREQVLDTESQSDRDFLAECQQLSVGRVHVRPASVAVLSEAGYYQVRKVDAIYCPLLDGQKHIVPYIYPSAECDVRVTAEGKWTPDDNVWAESAELVTPAVMTIV